MTKTGQKPSTLEELHKRIHQLLDEERKANKVTYNEKIPYQRYDRIRFEGLRWTPEKRIEDAGITRFVPAGGAVLDIGCNSGFLAIELAVAHGAGMVYGIEPNPWLVRVADLVAEHLGVKEKSRFIDCRFDEFREDVKFDTVLSLAAFYTQDGREREDAVVYFGRCRELLKKNGHIVYESTSFSEEEKGPHYDRAKMAVETMKKMFETVEHVIKPSGSPGWFREYFIGRKTA